MIRPVDHISTLSPYTLASLTAPVGKRLISLSQNESLRPPSPMALKAAAEAISGGQLYPDPNWNDLRSALAELHGIDVSKILCGNGSMELILCLLLAYADPNSAVLAPAHAYPFFRTATRLARARYDTAPESGGRVSIDALLAAVRKDTRIVLVANPGNPTGTRNTRCELMRLRNELPDDILLVIDEAYGEFTDGLDPPVFDLAELGNTAVLRSFSKAYGLAGLRVGWGVFPETIAAEIRKVMNPNNVSLAGQAAATAALSDQQYMRETCRLTGQLRDDFISRLRNAGFDLPGSSTNFALIRFDDAEMAESVDKALRREGVVARAQTGAGLPECLRVTVGAQSHLNLVAAILERWVEEEGK